MCCSGDMADFQFLKHHIEELTHQDSLLSDGFRLRLVSWLIWLFLLSALMLSIAGLHVYYITVEVVCSHCGTPIWSEVWKQMASPSLGIVVCLVFVSHVPYKHSLILNYLSISIFFHSNALSVFPVPTMDVTSHPPNCHSK